MSFFRKSVRPRSSRSRILRRVRLCLESLESRVTPYVASGNAWPVPQLVTISFVPDGTVLGQDVNGPISSNLFANFNQRFGSPAAWQNAIEKGAQAWAQQTNINLAIVTDNGTASGGGNYQQGDSGFGDIRIGSYNFGNTGLAWAYMPPPINNYSVAGDINFNSTTGFVLGTSGGFNLQTVAEHEFGHALGLDHTNVVNSAIVMWPSYTAYKVTLNSDDIAGIRNIYSGNNPRSADVYDAVTSNGSFATATNVNSLINGGSLTALVTGLDITATTDLDYYTFTAPTGSSSTLTVKVQSSGLSLLSPKVTVYASDQVTVLGSANGSGVYGTTLSVPVSGITAGQQFYVKVQGADSTAMSTGAYAMTLNFGTGASPTVPLPNTQTLNGNPISSGGGLALGSGHNGHEHDDDGDSVPTGGVGDFLEAPENASSILAPAVAVLVVAQSAVQTAAPATVVTSTALFAPVAVFTVETANPAPISRGVATTLESGGDAGTSGWEGLGIRLRSVEQTTPAAPVPESGAPVPAPAAAKPSTPTPIIQSEPIASDVCDACFADREWVADPAVRDTAAVPNRAEPATAALDPAAASVALAVVLGGYWGRRSEERERIRRTSVRC